MAEHRKGIHEDVVQTLIKPSDNQSHLENHGSHGIADRISLLRSVFTESLSVSSLVADLLGMFSSGRCPPTLVTAAMLPKLSDAIVALAEAVMHEQRLFAILERERAATPPDAQPEQGWPRQAAADALPQCPFAPGPVGESPVHICFLKRLKDTGKRIMDRFYVHPDPRLSSVSVAYTNDLDPWRGAARGEQGGDRDDGLFTGETCLHIAIVQEDAELVQFLLDRHISVASRAHGLFFQPARIRCALSARVPEPRGERQAGRLSHMWGWLRIRLSGWAGKGWAGHAVLANPLSGCYYGEYPLSFAASVGSVRVCEQLYNCAMRRSEARDGALGDAGEDVREREARGRVLSPRLGLAGAVGAEEDLACGAEGRFLNAADSFGNTAMHLAVMYGRREVVDWLLTKEAARESLESLNHEGLTPLTLAARLGRVDIFDHILIEHMSVFVWKYGKVPV